jgi:hypothetical protein
MSNQFDELTKSLAQSVTRRGALNKFGIGLAGMAMACFGLANKAKAATGQGYCGIYIDPFTRNTWYTGMCVDIKGCIAYASVDCPAYGTPAKGNVKVPFGCLPPIATSRNKCSFTI